MTVRERIYQIIEPAQDGDRLNKAYDLSMIVIIIISLVPLAFKQNTPGLIIIDQACVAIFIIGYVLRLITADIKLHHGAASFMMYPVTP